MTLCPYCHHWLSLCRCPVVDLSARDSSAQIPRGYYDAYVGSEVPPYPAAGTLSERCADATSRESGDIKDPRRLAGDCLLLCAAASIEQ